MVCPKSPYYQVKLILRPLDGGNIKIEPQSEGHPPSNNYRPLHGADGENSKTCVLSEPSQHPLNKWRRMSSKTELMQDALLDALPDALPNALPNQVEKKEDWKNG